MLEKLAAHKVETVTTLFALADKCAKAAEGRAWHSVPQGGPAQTGGSSVAAPGSDKNKNKKNCGINRPQAGAPVAAATTAGGQNSRGKRPCQQRTDPGSCPVHPGARHNALECSRSKNSRSASARGMTRPPWMAPPHRGDPAKRKSLTPML
jgi:hypothetical protein